MRQDPRTSASFPLDNVARLAEPLLLAFAGLMAVFLAIATLLPIINMVQNI